MTGDPRIGTTLGGRYRIERKLGEGGMGAVYAATQEPLGRRVALKVLLPILAQDANIVLRFRREAELAASLGHPNIVQVTDFGAEPDGSVYLVMDLLDGESLGGALEREGRLAPERVRFIAMQVLSALEAAHERGVVHRDLKPDNIFLTSVSGVSDLVKLLDFGIARLAESEGIQKMTATGQVLGTPAYMSPEQARGREVDARSDLYALGVVIYECLTGRMPISGANYHELMFNLVQEPPTPILQLAPELDRGFVDVIERAMVKDPNARFSSARAMHEALAALGPLQATRPLRVPSHPPTRAADVALAATVTPEALAALTPTSVSAATGTPVSVSAATGTPTSVSAATGPRRGGVIAAGLAAALVLGLVAVGAFLIGSSSSQPTAAHDPIVEPATPPLAAGSPTDVPVAEGARPASEGLAPDAPAGAGASEASEASEADAVAAEETPGAATEDAPGAAAEGGPAAEGVAATDRGDSTPRTRRTAPRTKAAPAMARLPATQTVQCGGRSEEIPIVQRGDTITVNYRETNRVIPMDAFRDLTTSWSPALTRCYVGLPFVAGTFTIDVNAQGTVTGVRQHEHCIPPPALGRCVQQALMGASVGNDTGAPAIMRFGVNHRVAR